MGLRDKLLSVSDLRTKEVEVPSWGAKLTIRELNLQESMDAFSNIKPDDDGNVTLGYDDVAKVVAFGVIDEDGERVFTDEDVPVLAKKGKAALMKLYTEITMLSGTVEDEVKN